MSDNDPIVNELKKLSKNPRSTLFDFAQVFGVDNSTLKNNQARMRELMAWQQHQALNEADAYIHDLMGKRDTDLKSDPLIIEHARFAFVLRWAITNHKGTPIFESGQQVLQLFTPFALEAVWNLYTSTVAKANAKRELDSEEVLKVCHSLALLDEQILAAAQQSQANGEDVSNTQQLVNVALSGLSRFEIEELLIRLSIIAKGIGLFDAPQD